MAKNAIGTRTVIQGRRPIDVRIGCLGRIERIRCSRIIFAALFLAVLGAASARCEEPAALVEEVSPDVPGLSAFDYLSVNRQLDLGASGQVTLGYLAGCTQETIRGGHVTVGAAGSAVVGGQLSRRTVRCPPAVRPAAADSSQSGAMVFRAPPSAQTIGAIYPLITLPTPGRVVITATDGAEAPLIIDADGRTVDLAALGHALRPKRTYKIEYAGRSAIVRVAPDASGSVPLLTRLIRF
jgi:hypothetical protein